MMSVQGLLRRLGIVLIAQRLSEILSGGISGARVLSKLAAAMQASPETAMAQRSCAELLCRASDADPAERSRPGRCSPTAHVGCILCSRIVHLTLQ